MRYIVFIITALSLVGCNLGNSPETIAAVTPTAIESEATQEALGNVHYWQMLPINELTPTADDIVLFEQIVLSKVESDALRTGFAVIDLETAMQDMINSATVWTSDNLIIESIMIQDRVATLRLTGTITAVGGAILSAVSLQFQLTVFEENSIDSVLITLNGENIANLGISNDSQAQAVDFLFTREALSTTLANMP